MVLNNYWKAMEILTKSTSERLSLIGLNGENAVGAEDTVYINTADANYVSNSRLRTEQIGVRLGSGDGTITVNDYSLFDDCTDDVSNFVVSNSVGQTDEGFSQVITITGTNNTESDLVITEVGITKKFYCHSPWSASSVLSGEVMLVKALLTNPITVQPQSGFNLVLEWVES